MKEKIEKRLSHFVQWRDLAICLNVFIYPSIYTIYIYIYIYLSVLSTFLQLCSYLFKCVYLSIHLYNIHCIYIYLSIYLCYLPFYNYVAIGLNVCINPSLYKIYIYLSIYLSMLSIFVQLCSYLFKCVYLSIHL